MEASNYRNYETVVQEYLTEFNALLALPAEDQTTARRGVAGVEAEVLVERADRIAEISAEMVPLARVYLGAEDLTEREGVGAQLLTQAAVELQLATELLQLAPDGTDMQMGATARRGASGAELRDAIQALQRSLQQPVSQGLAPATATRSATSSTSDAEAKKALRDAVGNALSTISQHVSELGGDITFNLITVTEWTAVVRGAGLLRPDVAAELESLKQEVGRFFENVLSVVIKTLLNVYDKILALLGKDTEGEARNRITEWLDQMAKEKNIDLFESLVAKLYRVDPFRQDLDRRLASTGSSIETFDRTTDAVKDVSSRFVVLAGRLRFLHGAMTLAKSVKYPQVALVVVGLQVALLAVVVYGGYDYIWYREGRLLDMTQGVAQVIEANLGAEPRR